MLPPLCIFVDWGTTRLRATLCRQASGQYREVDACDGPGVLAAKGHIEATLFATIDAWVSAHGKIPLLLAGMVGSNIGWRNLPYLQCPLYPADIAGQCLTFESRGHAVTMVPGLVCTNDLGYPDSLRGEELQVLGWLAEDSTHGSGDWLVCLPGTHTKWVSVRDGCIVSFCTALTGELYALLTQHSVLLAAAPVLADESAFEADAFTAGVDVAAKDSGAIMHLLFSVRSRMLQGQLTPDTAPSYLSGMLIGTDCATMLARQRDANRKVAIVGEAGLCQRFSVALARLGVAGHVLDGRRASFNGFESILREQHTGDSDIAATL